MTYKFKIRKRISNTKAPLAGIGFKIRVQTSEGWRWMRFDRRRDDGTDEVRLFADRDKGEPESASDYYLTSDFSEATMIKLQDNGETETIYKVPIYKDGDRDSKLFETCRQ